MGQVLDYAHVSTNDQDDASLQVDARTAADCYRVFVDTTSPGGRLVFDVFAALAEFERDLVRECTNGRPGGRAGTRAQGWAARGAVGPRVSAARRMHEQQETKVPQIGHVLGVRGTTIYRALGLHPAPAIEPRRPGSTVQASHGRRRALTDPQAPRRGQDPARRPRPPPRNRAAHHGALPRAPPHRRAGLAQHRAPTLAPTDRLAADLVSLIEGLAPTRPRRPILTIHRSIARDLRHREVASPARWGGLADADARPGDRMSLVRVHNFSVSLDGFGTGEGQQLDAPFGHAGSRLLEWAFPTRTFKQMGLHGEEEGSDGVDEAFAGRWATGIGVEIMGRNKFGPQRGPWADEEWRGWWGDNPPFHTPVIVLTHHSRPPLEMEGGTTFHFVDAEPAEALEQARALAGDRDVRIGGGVTTIRRFLEADLIDQMHIVVVPILLGRGERLWDGLEALEQRFHIEAAPSPSGVIHLTFARRDEAA